MTTVKVEARGWIFLLQLFPLSADLAGSYSFNLPSSSSPAQPSFPPTCHKKTLLGSASATAGKYFNRSPFDKWLEIRLKTHITFENNGWTLQETTCLGCKLLYTALQLVLKPTLVSRGTPLPIKPHTSWYFITRISDQWQQWILRWSSFYRQAL